MIFESENTNELYLLLEKSFRTADLFPAIDISSSYEATNIRRFLQSKSISALQKLLSAASLTPRIGYNFSSSEISLTFQITPTKSQQQPEKDDKIDELTKQRSLVIWTMLGIHKDQTILESLNQTNISLANACVELFAKHTGVAMCTRRIDFLQQTLRVAICPFKETKNPNYEFRLFQYSPSYMQLTGFDSFSNSFTEQVLEEQRLNLIISMVDYFWEAIEQQNYLINDYIKSELTNSLIDYIESGISLHTCHSSIFSPKNSSKAFHLYLYGTAGVGKSSFVKAFRKAFENTLIRFVDANQRVVIVKLPLNSVSPGHLLSILRVKGISDMSIERVIEQTLCKGQIVIFHLEENPEEFEIQRQLYYNIQIMLDKLTDRYREYRSNVMCFYTSNYEPVPDIVSTVNLLPMVPPNESSQRLWCERSLQDSISSHTPFKSISIHFITPPPYSEDLRPLERWWRSIGFHIIKSIRNFISNNKSEMIIEYESHIKVSIDQGEDNQKLLIKIEIENYTNEIETVELAVSNSWFCYYQGDLNHHFLLENNDNNYQNYIIEKQEIISELPKESHCTLLTVIDMLVYSYVKPAIVVLVGPLEQRQKYIKMIQSYLLLIFSERLKHTEVSLKEEKDKTKVFGEPGEILGGLFRFIDCVNNPNACKGRTDLFGLIVNHVNEMGQFILRELIEADPSRTHRQTAHKDRLMFVLSVDEDCEITPQLNSRAHTILIC